MRIRGKGGCNRDLMRSDHALILSKLVCKKRLTQIQRSSDKGGKKKKSRREKERKKNEPSRQLVRKRVSWNAVMIPISICSPITNKPSAIKTPERWGLWEEKSWDGGKLISGSTRSPILRSNGSADRTVAAACRGKGSMREGKGGKTLDRKGSGKHLGGVVCTRMLGSREQAADETKVSTI